MEPHFPPLCLYSAGHRNAHGPPDRVVSIRIWESPCLSPWGELDHRGEEKTGLRRPFRDEGFASPSSLLPVPLWPHHTPLPMPSHFCSVPVGAHLTARLSTIQPAVLIRWKAGTPAPYLIVDLRNVAMLSAAGSGPSSLSSFLPPLSCSPLALVVALSLRQCTESAQSIGGRPIGWADKFCQSFPRWIGSFLRADTTANFKGYRNAVLQRCRNPFAALAKAQRNWSLSFISCGL